jgi:hypothetical protein
VKAHEDEEMVKESQRILRQSNEVWARKRRDREKAKSSEGAKEDMVETADSDISWLFTWWMDACLL